MKPWEYVLKYASRIVRVKLNEAGLESVTCKLYGLNQRPIKDRADWQATRHIDLSSFPIDIDFGTYKRHGLLTPAEHVNNAAAIAVGSFLETVTFRLAPTNDAANYYSPSHFNFKLTCVEFPHLNIIHETPHSDSFLHWQEFFDAENPHRDHIQKLYIAHKRNNGESST